MSEFWAHSDPIQLLADHLRHVAVIAEHLAKSAAPEEAALHTMAHLAGLLHDYGKYTECFQQRVRGSGKPCPHSIHGAIAVRQFGLRPGSPLRHWAMPVVHAIAAHHAGLHDHSGLDLLTRPSNPTSDSKARREEATKIWKTALTDQPAIRTALLAEAPAPVGSTKDMLTRILLSCLVDADRLDSAGRQPAQAPLDANGAAQPADGLSQ